MGFGSVAADIRIQTSSIQFNPKWVKSVWIMDDPNPLPGILVPKRVEDTHTRISSILFV
jgi:hypothetical protein